MAPIELFHAVKTAKNLQFIKNELSVRHSKVKLNKIRYTCIRKTHTVTRVGLQW